MAKYERIIPLENVPFCQVILDYTMAFNGRNIYVSDNTYVAMLDFLGISHFAVRDVIKNDNTDTRIFKSYRVPDYVAYAIKQ